jgi:hypothetical protein
VEVILGPQPAGRHRALETWPSRQERTWTTCQVDRCPLTAAEHDLNEVQVGVVILATWRPGFRHWGTLVSSAIDLVTLGKPGKALKPLDEADVRDSWVMETGRVAGELRVGLHIGATPGPG